MKTKLILFSFVLLSGVALYTAFYPASDGETVFHSKHVVAITTENFEQEIIKSKELVILDFWAPYCAPCKLISPRVSDIADKYAGRVKVAQVDVSEEGLNARYNKVESIADQYGVATLPMIKFFKDGKMIDEIPGLASKKDLEEKIKKHL